MQQIPRRSGRPLKSGKRITTLQMQEKVRLGAMPAAREAPSQVHLTTTLWEVAILACGYRNMDDKSQTTGSSEFVVCFSFVNLVLSHQFWPCTPPSLFPPKRHPCIA